MMLQKMSVALGVILILLFLFFTTLSGNKQVLAVTYHHEVNVVVDI